MEYKNIPENELFEIAGLSGYYKVDHANKIAIAYDKGGPILNYKGVVKGLYQNLMAGRYKIKLLR